MREAVLNRQTRCAHWRRQPILQPCDINAKVADNASLDDLLERIKTELTTLAPILELEVVSEPERSRKEGGLTVANCAVSRPGRG
jgi:hypothetical protein